MEVKIYDPEVNLSRIRGSNKAFVEESIPHIASIMVDDPNLLIRDSKVIVLGARDETVEMALRSAHDSTRAIVDLVGVPNRAGMAGDYHGVCW